MTTVHLGGDLTFDTTFPQRFQVLADTGDGVRVVRSTASQNMARSSYDNMSAPLRWLLDRDDPEDHVIATTFAAVHLPDEPEPEPMVDPTKLVRPRPPRRVIDHNPDDPAHGTPAGYQRFGCRCQRCREANTAATRLYRQNKRGTG